MIKDGGIQEYLIEPESLICLVTVSQSIYHFLPNLRLLIKKMLFHSFFFLYLLLPIRAHKSTVLSRNND